MLCYISEEGINDISFPLLDRETIQKLFPKCGPRLIFEKHYKQYYTSENQVEVLELSDLESTSRSSTSKSSYSEETENTLVFEPDDQLIQLLQAHSTPKKAIEVAPSTDFEEAGPSREVHEQPGPSKKQKICGESQHCSVFPQGLEAVLKKYVDGNLVVLNKDRLNNNLRQKLVRCTINELIATYGISIKGEIFQKTSREIEECFINERADSYYVPYCPLEKANKKCQTDSNSIIDSSEEEKKGIGPKGKLWNKYVNIKHALKTANSLKVCETKEHNSPETFLEEEHQINFLKIATEPFPKILEAWENSLKLRRKLYRNVGLTEIFKEFPCLQLNSGIELIESDFNQRFGDKIDIIYDTWPKVSSAILNEAAERKIQFPEISSCEKTIRTLLSLPYLCPPITLKKSRKGSKQLEAREKRNSR